MTGAIVASPRRLPGALTGMITAQFDLRQPEDEIARQSEFNKIADGAAAIVITAFDEFDAGRIQSLPESVQLAASIGVGVDHIDLGAAEKRGLMITNTPDVTTPCLADATIGLIIAACRRFREGLEIAKTGEGRGMLTPESWGQRVTGRTLGVIGMGNVGKAVAKRAHAFDMEIIYTTPRPNPEIDDAYNARRVDLETLLKTADVISLHCPLKDETKHLIDAAAIELMKPSAVIINISRGPVIDETALVTALRDRRIFAAGLDVFETEPEPIREELRTLDNVYCLPHIASATWESRAGMAARVVENLAAFFREGEPRDRVV